MQKHLAKNDLLALNRIILRTHGDGYLVVETSPSGGGDEMQQIDPESVTLRVCLLAMTNHWYQILTKPFMLEIRLQFWAHLELERLL